MRYTGRRGTFERLNLRHRAMVPETCETGVMRVRGLVRNHTTSRRWIEIKRAQSVVDYVNGTGYLREDPGEMWERPDLKSG